MKRRDSSWFPGASFTDEVPQGHIKRSGVVLRRWISPEGDATLYLFLKGTGPLTVYAPGATRGRIRFGGGIEPLTWANFNLYRGTKHFYLTSAEVKEDFWPLRDDPEKIAKLIDWDGLLCRHLAPGLPCDEVLALYYWSGVQLKSGVHPMVAEWRFLWKWLHNWGLAPSTEDCVKCGAPLTSARLSLYGFLCPSCSPSAEGASLSDSDMKSLRLSLSTPVSALAGLFHSDRFTAGPPWQEINTRLRHYFDSLN